MATIYNFSFFVAVYESKLDNISKTLTSVLHYHYHVSCLSLPSNLCIESIILHIVNTIWYGTVWQYCLWSFKPGNTNLNDLRMGSYENLDGLMASSQKMGNFDFQNWIWNFLFLNLKLHTSIVMIRISIKALGTAGQVTLVSVFCHPYFSFWL